MTKKSDSETGHKEVVEFLENLEHPLKNEIIEVREIILSVNENLNEHIKWKAPSFCLSGDDRITFNLHGKDFFRLIFHCGSKISNKNLKDKMFEETRDFMEWASEDRAIAKFTDKKDIESKKEILINTVNKWLELSS